MILLFLLFCLLQWYSDCKCCLLFLRRDSIVFNILGWCWDDLLPSAALGFSFHTYRWGSPLLSLLEIEVQIRSQMWKYLANSQMLYKCEFIIWKSFHYKWQKSNAKHYAKKRITGLLWLDSRVTYKSEGRTLKSLRTRDLRVQTDGLYDCSI